MAISKRPLSTQGLRPAKEQTSWNLVLSNSKPLFPGILRGKIFIETNDEEMPLMETPYIGLVSNEIQN